MTYLLANMGLKRMHVDNFSALRGPNPIVVANLNGMEYVERVSCAISVIDAQDAPQKHLNVGMTTIAFGAVIRHTHGEYSDRK